MKKWKKRDLTPPRSAGLTVPYLPKMMAQVEANKPADAVKTLYDAAVDYFTRISRETETIPAADGAIMAKLLRHMADEIERADPQAKKINEALKDVPLPAIDYKHK